MRNALLPLVVLLAWIGPVATSRLRTVIATRRHMLRTGPSLARRAPTTFDELGRGRPCSCLWRSSTRSTSSTIAASPLASPIDAKGVIAWYGQNTARASSMNWRSYIDVPHASCWTRWMATSNGASPSVTAGSYGRQDPGRHAVLAIFALLLTGQLLEGEAIGRNYVQMLVDSFQYQLRYSGYWATLAMHLEVLDEPRKEQFWAWYRAFPRPN